MASLDGVPAPAGGFQPGGWYNGRQYWAGRLGPPGVIINPEQSGYNQPVSAEVNRQSDVAQGNPQGTIQAYLAQQNASYQTPAQSTAPRNTLTSTVNPKYDTSGDQQALLDAQQALFEKHQAEENAFLGEFDDAVSGLPRTADLAKDIGDELGLPNLRQNAFDLGETLRNVQGVQTQATRGFDVNANQLARIIAAEQGKIAPAAQEAIRQQQFAEGLLGERLGFELQDRELALLPFETRAKFISDRAAREVTGFTAAMQKQFDVILQKIQANADLTIAEMEQATEFAKMEDAYNLERFKTDEAIREHLATKDGTAGKLSFEEIMEILNKFPNGQGGVPPGQYNNLWELDENSSVNPSRTGNFDFGAA